MKTNLTNLEMAALVSAMTGLPFLQAAELVAKSDAIEILLPCCENPPVQPDVTPDADSFAA